MSRVVRSDQSSDADLLDEVLERIGDRSESLASFARAYLRRLPFDAAMAAEPACCEVENLFDFIEVREGPIDVRVFNPDRTQHGYQSAGTVVETHVDDAPFLVDSVIGELQARDLEVVRVLHPVIGTVRDDTGRLRALMPAARADTRESVQHYVLDTVIPEEDHAELESRIRVVLGDVLAAVRDFPAMVEASATMMEIARQGKDHYPDTEVDEAVAFLEWLNEDNFVFLGYREYRIVDTPQGRGLEVVSDSGLGILADPRASKAYEPVPFSSLPEEVIARYEQGGLLVISKTNRVSTVHRRARMDYVGVRMLGPDGETVGEARLIGLFTSKAYMESVGRIPVLRQKLAEVASAEDLIEGSHDHKAIVSLIEGFPKDELFGLPTEDLRRVVMGLLALQERAQVRLFVRRDLLDRGVRILVAMPRDRFSSELRKKLQDLFVKRYGGVGADYHLTLGRSDIARLHFTVWVPEGQIPDVAFDQLDAEVMALTRSWSERVVAELVPDHGAARAKEMVDRWGPRLPDYYKSSTQVEVAAGDIAHLTSLLESGDGSYVGLQNEARGPDVLTRVALYELEGKRALSELTPALEDMGMTVVEEVPTRLLGDEDLFIHDFGVLDPAGERLDLEETRERVSGALTAVWEGQAESDSLNRLVLAAGLDHHQVAILRAYQTYWRRVSPIFTVNYVNDTLVKHPEIAAGLVRLFELRFDPASDGAGYDAHHQGVVEALDAVPSLDEDRILRGFLRLIDATTRTNAYRPDRRSLAFKLRSADVPDMPSPAPLVEVFVLGEEVEGIHLRAGLRARGGIRWSERREDYRTEVLGLMKAQVTKNAIIVPTGAKGGFVLRRPPSEADAVGEAVASAYETYIRGLLDLADTLEAGEVVQPENVRVHDGTDPYLVVAADRGTARLSDTANRIAQEYEFWLDDAFASGGATGYDHKALGITARGAWKSLERHFLEEGIDPHSDPFTVVGIGDMSGDVFGNGMLGSETIKLVAAFDHRHVFVDPDPDPAQSFRERQRLFDLPRSSWNDYSTDLISEGGGVFSRTAKKIDLSDQARKALGTDAERVTPAELIHIILQAPVDLLWNGGIGTYVKASGESHLDVGDRANDSVRVDAAELRARVVVEGGNLGLTQRARIEYAATGGRINADFIDNSGGVNCSDREVNLKILLRLAEQRDEIDRAERDDLLAGAADAVVEAILYDNLAQAQLLAVEAPASAERMDAYEQLISSLEDQGLLDREMGVLPSPQEMRQRMGTGQGLSRPELAVVLAHAKRSVGEAILDSSIPDDETLVEELAAYFPPAISSRFPHLLWDHPLRRELIATIVANDVVNSQGPTFVSRIVSRRGVQPAQVVAAFRTARAVAGVDRRRQIETLFQTVDLDVWVEMMAADSRLVFTLTRWYLTHVPEGLGQAELERTARRFADLEKEAREWGSLQRRAERSARMDRLRSAGVPPALVLRTAVAIDLVHAPDILEVAEATGRPVGDVGVVFHRIGRVMGLDALEQVVSKVKLADMWQGWALQTIEDDLLAVRRSLAERILIGTGAESVEGALDEFLSEKTAEAGRVAELVGSLQSQPINDVAPLMVAVRQLQSLAGA